MAGIRVTRWGGHSPFCHCSLPAGDTSLILVWNEYSSHSRERYVSEENIAPGFLAACLDYYSILKAEAVDVSEKSVNFRNKRWHIPEGNQCCENLKPNTQKVHYRVHRSSLLESVRGEMNPQSTTHAPSA